MKVCEYIAGFLQLQGVKDIFGIPGSWIMPVWQELDGLLHLCNNEADAAYMAVGYGKKSRRPGIVITTTGPGITNAVSGIASAYQDSIPLIHISGCQPVNEEGSGCFQEESNYDRCFRAKDLLDSITKECFYPTTPIEAVEMIRTCWSIAVSNRCGSVHISIPIDIQNAELGDYRIEPLTESVGNQSDDSIVGIIFEKPLIVLGWGAYLSNASEPIYQLAKKINAPVLSTMKGLSAVQYDSDFHLGTLGFHFTSFTEEFICQYGPKSVFIFGSSIGRKDFTDSFVKLLESANSFCFTDDPANINKRLLNVRIFKTNHLIKTISTLFDIAPTIEQNERMIDLIKKYKEQYINNNLKMITRNNTMSSAIALLCNYNMPDVILTADAGNHYLNAIAFSKPRYAGSFFVDVGLAAMGIGISETIGMVYSDKTKKYIAITGDGCMLMNGNSIYSAVRDRLPIVFVVFNNSCLGRVREGQKNMNKIVGSDLGNVNFKEYACAFGIKHAYQTNSVEILKYIIDEFLEAPCPYFIEYICSKDETPLIL